ncbi:TetR/AcrR family transcriptional regulator [Brevundimonas diminuta]|uniref:TetR/AcrR family transcriptional regulator n=1 Tax=Brevundimonas diminuta TaxID=293 RepID=UPI003209D6B4
MRQDAAERRERLLKAAEEAFAREGLDAPLHLIAEQAGVGRATLYRNFADRSELALAVFVQQIEDLGRRTRTRLDDPDAFIWFLEQVTRLMLDNAGLSSAIRDLKDEALAPIRRGMKQAGAEALAASQAAGRVRGDLTTEDIRVITLMLGAPSRTVAPQDREALSRRSLELVLDAIRPRPADHKGDQTGEAA